MSDLIKVTVIAQEDPITVNVEEPAKIEVRLYPVSVAHPSILQAATNAESSAESSLASAQAASQAAAQAQEAVAGIGPTVEQEVEDQLANLPTLETQNESGYVYIKGDEATDNSWRFFVDGDNKLTLQIRLASVWTMKGRWNP